MRVEISAGIVYDRVEVRLVGKWMFMADDVGESLGDVLLFFVSRVLGVDILIVVIIFIDRDELKTGNVEADCKFSGESLGESLGEVLLPFV